MKQPRLLPINQRDTICRQPRASLEQLNRLAMDDIWIGVKWGGARGSSMPDGWLSNLSSCHQWIDLLEEIAEVDPRLL